MRPAKILVNWTSDKILAITDAGAMSNLIGFNLIKKFGLTKADLVKVKVRMKAINNEDINVIGAIFLRVSGVDEKSGKKAETAVMAYVSDSTEDYSMSRDCMEKLGIIGTDFPRIGTHLPRIKTHISSLTTQRPPNTGDIAPCGCPTHQLPPPLPSNLPYEPIPANIDKMKLWLLNHFKASAFNRCPHQRLPLMDCPPIRIHVEENARPQVVHTAATVPVYWREEVNDQLDEDVALGVISKIPVGVPTTWCHRMHVVPKLDGTPVAQLTYAL